MKIFLILTKTCADGGVRVPEEGMAAVGFPHFGAAHLFWLAGLGTAAMTAAFFHERTDEKSRLRMRKGLGLLCFLFHLLTQGIFLVRGTYGLYDLPLHLCALTAYLVLLHAAAGEKSMVSATVGEILFFPCLPGLLSALAFPGWNESPALSFYSVSSFLSHGAMALYVILCLKSGSIRPCIKRCWIPALFLAVYTGLVLPFDLACGTNFGFLKEPVPGTPLQLIADLMGEGAGYRAGFAFLVLVLEFICYLVSGIFTGQKKGL